MTQPSRVIYLPPGLVPAPAPPADVHTAGSGTGIPFDRQFFTETLPASVQVFCEQAVCPVPVVEVLTVDGTTHYVNAVAGASDSWVALQTANVEHEHPTHVFIPYLTIFRVEIHPEPDVNRQRLGFVTRAEGQAEDGATAWKQQPRTAGAQRPTDADRP
ncbi:MAG: hypothetical protein WEC33_01980 [Dehalococcoidia bacterium]